MAEDAAKFLEYAAACREIMKRTPDPEGRQTLMMLAEAWEELARNAQAKSKPKNG
jgi:hypothetical protein